ncbi:MAG: DUF3291 domain-containing protein [Solirubrobacteraceae bacterium]
MLAPCANSRDLDPSHYSLQIAAPVSQVAQVNIALPREPLHAPLLAQFVALLGPINALADRSPGFVWRLQTEAGNATAMRVFDDDRLIVNLSVWQSIDALSDFVYRSAHVDVMRRRREWFQQLRFHMTLWWVFRPVTSRP